MSWYQGTTLIQHAQLARHQLQTALSSSSIKTVRVSFLLAVCFYFVIAYGLPAFVVALDTSKPFFLLEAATSRSVLSYVTSS
ncbi:hypothetical protein GYMLUDRAFT_35582 [Collybiopsis luxurians FD-317 M1]|nr:hypothetical protein GYMLUDRAFT_35582 [Collybiopsis luxurians FD-317 M1]